MRAATDPNMSYRRASLPLPPKSTTHNRGNYREIPLACQMSLLTSFDNRLAPNRSQASRPLGRGPASTPSEERPNPPRHLYPSTKASCYLVYPPDSSLAKRVLASVMPIPVQRIPKNLLWAPKSPEFWSAPAAGLLPANRIIISPLDFSPKPNTPATLADISRPNVAFVSTGLSANASSDAPSSGAL